MPCSAALRGGVLSPPGAQNTPPRDAALSVYCVQSACVLREIWWGPSRRQVLPPTLGGNVIDFKPVVGAADPPGVLTAQPHKFRAHLTAESCQRSVGAGGGRFPTNARARVSLRW